MANFDRDFSVSQIIIGKNSFFDSCVMIIRDDPHHREMQTCAAVIWQIAHSQPEAGMYAFAHVMRNRRAKSQAFLALHRRNHPEFGSANLHDAAQSVATDLNLASPATTSVEMSFDRPDYCRAFAALCLVLAGDYADLTGGASYFHRHDENPKWARGATPSALIGSYFFFPSSPRRQTPPPESRTSQTFIPSSDFTD